jgi:hypothetical protein
MTCFALNLKCYSRTLKTNSNSTWWSARTNNQLTRQSFINQSEHWCEKDTIAILNRRGQQWLALTLSPTSSSFQVFSAYFHLEWGWTVAILAAADVSAPFIEYTVTLFLDIQVTGHNGLAKIFCTRWYRGVTGPFTPVKFLWQNFEASLLRVRNG